jgi:tetratricopeptide (TPR) repeat protein
MLQNSNQLKQHANNFGAMESGDHSKNGASPKSLMSRRNSFICCKTAICLAFFVLFAGIQTVYAQQNVTEEVKRYTTRAQSAYNRGDFDKALTEYKAAQKLVPQYPELYKAIGDVYEKLGGTANLTEAIANYKQYLKLEPKATDFDIIQKRIWELEEFSEETAKQDFILDDLSGEWVAVDNFEVTGKDENGNIKYLSDAIFNIKEIEKTGTYRITIQQKGSRLYSENIIDETVNVKPAKDNSFTFVFAEASAHTPKSGGYNFAKFLGGLAAQKVGVSWVSELTNVVVDAAQESDLPSNAQTAYTFAIRYDTRKLVGLVNIVDKFVSAKKQKTRKNELRTITFEKNDMKFRDSIKQHIENLPDTINILVLRKDGYYYDIYGSKVGSPVIIISMRGTGVNDSRRLVDKYNQKLTHKEVMTKISALNPELGKKYNSNTSTKQRNKFIQEYNKQVIEQQKNDIKN